MAKSLITPVWKAVELDSFAALDYWLALTPQCNSAVTTISHTKLSAATHHGASFAIPNEDACLAWAHKEPAVGAFINVDTG